MSESLDTENLESEVTSMYRDVAESADAQSESADAEFHFETGLDGDRAGDDPDTLTSVPDGARFSDVHSTLAEDR